MFSSGACSVTGTAPRDGGERLDVDGRGQCRPARGVDVRGVRDRERDRDVTW